MLALARASVGRNRADLLTTIDTLLRTRLNDLTRTALETEWTSAPTSIRGDRPGLGAFVFAFI